MLNTRTFAAAGLAALLAATSFAVAAPITGPTDRPIEHRDDSNNSDQGDDLFFRGPTRPLPPLCKIVDGGIQLYNNTGETIKKGTVLHIVLLPSGKTIDWTVTKDIPAGSAGVIKNLISPRD